jgi:hypothetical protein
LEATALLLLILAELMSVGAFCISIDLELGWGIWDRPQAAYFALCAEKERGIVRRLLDLFSRHEVPVTWAIVGRLLAQGRTPAPELPRGDSIWYAPDLIDAILEARPTHEIGSHSYAHVYFDQVSTTAVREDLEAARAVHKSAGLGFKSFVFPRNGVANVDLLREFGLQVYRGADRGWPTSARQRWGRTVGRAAHLVDKALPTAPAIVRPQSIYGSRAVHDLTELPGSLLLMGRGGVRALLPPRAIVAKVRRGLDRAASGHSGGVFHLWFHPSNFYYDTERQFGILDTALGAAATLRDRGRLRIAPMSAFADLQAA